MKTKSQHICCQKQHFWPSCSTVVVARNAEVQWLNPYLPSSCLTAYYIPVKWAVRYSAASPVLLADGFCLEPVAWRLVVWLKAIAGRIGCAVDGFWYSCRPCGIRVVPERRNGKDGNHAGQEDVFHPGARRISKLVDTYDILDPQTQAQIGIAKERPGWLAPPFPVNAGAADGVRLRRRQSGRRAEVALPSRAVSLPAFESGDWTRPARSGWFKSKMFSIGARSRLRAGVAGRS